MKVSEIENKLENFIKSNKLEEYFLKYPVDMLLDFNKHNIKEKLEDNSNQIFKYKKLLFKATTKYNEIKTLHEEIIGNQYNWYKFEYNKPLTNEEIIKYFIKRDPQYTNTKRLLNKQKIKKEFFQSCVDAFINQGNRIHDYIKVLEIEK